MKRGGRKSIVTSHKAHLSFAAESSTAVSLPRQRGEQSERRALQTKAAPASAHQSADGNRYPPHCPLLCTLCSPTRGAEGRRGSDIRNVGHVLEIHILSVSQSGAPPSPRGVWVGGQQEAEDCWEQHICARASVGSKGRVVYALYTATDKRGT